MDILASIMTLTMIVLLIRTVIAIAAGIIMTRKIKKAQENGELETVNRELLEQRLQQLAQVQKAQMVKDDYCGKLIDKSKAYIIRNGDTYRHFCSWDCRQKYIENMGA